ncbi:MAG: glycosyltransferase family 2 protein, partial [Paludibacter sp.]
SGYFSALLKVSNVSAVTGACLMIRKKLFNEVGGLDEKLKIAFNDVDFCLRVLIKGLYNVVLPHVQLYHYESKSRGYEDTPEKQERFRGEVKLMQDRWREILAKDPFYNVNLTREFEDFSILISKDNSVY